MYVLLLLWLGKVLLIGLSLQVHDIDAHCTWWLICLWSVLGPGVAFGKQNAAAGWGG